MQNQQGDIKIVDTVDGANFEMTNGILAMTGGLDSAVYLSLFGGDDKPFWMNEILTGSEKITCLAIPYLRGQAITITTLQRADQLLLQDLQWFKDDGICDAINTEISQTGKNGINISIELLTNGDLLYKNTYSVNWNNQAAGV